MAVAGVLRRGERGRALGRRPPLLRGRDRCRPHCPRDPGAAGASCGTVIASFSGEHVGAPSAHGSSCTTTSCTWTSTCSPRRRRANTMPASLSSSCGIATGSPPGSPRMIGPTSRVTCDGSRTGCGPGAGTSSRRSPGRAVRGTSRPPGDARDRVLFRLLAFERGTRPAGARRVEAALGDRREAFSSTITSADDPAAVLSAPSAEIGLYLELSGRCWPSTACHRTTEPERSCTRLWTRGSAGPQAPLPERSLRCPRSVTSRRRR